MQQLKFLPFNMLTEFDSSAFDLWVGESFCFKDLYGAEAESLTLKITIMVK